MRNWNYSVFSQVILMLATTVDQIHMHKVKYSSNVLDHDLEFIQTMFNQRTL